MGEGDEKTSIKLVTEIAKMLLLKAKKAIKDHNKKHI